MSMSEELETRLAAKPDKWTLAWWNQQFQEVLKSNNGLKHALHLALAANEDLGKQVKFLQDQLSLVNADAVADRAKIGELQEAVSKAVDRLDRQGEFLNTLKKVKP